jgi:hypothetical protein
MSEFDRRWQDTVGRACQAANEAGQMPAGFSTRVWARWTSQSRTSPSDAWVAISFRALVLATIVLLVCGLGEYFAAASESVLSPHLEDAVASVWGTL